MSDTPDVWASSDASPASTAELPPVVSLLTDTFEHFQKYMGPMLLLGTGAVCVLIPVTLMMVLVGVAPMLGAVIAESEALLLPAMLWYMVVILAAVMIVNPPLMWGAHRAVWAHMQGDEEALGFTGVFRHMLPGLAGAILLMLILTVLTMIGALFCYIPALIVAMATSLAMPGMVVHKLSPIEAIQRSVASFREHMGWHAGMWALGLVIVMVASNIPIFGAIVATPFSASYHLRAYRAAFPDPE